MDSEHARDDINQDDQSLICNPHEHIEAQPKNKFAIVRGRYIFYHYGQNEIEDSGWGCAYRSFQTVCSWLKFQGSIEGSIPNHRQIQQTLVNIANHKGDKPQSFLGSHNWIGSLELSYCLQSLFGITSKILSSRSGADLTEHARALIYHFENGGAPVMIGGGQLAHTIIGIDYNPRLGDCRYLILDPHYTGPDKINNIIDGSWCAWKPATFWSKKDYYNLLLVINPTQKEINTNND